MQLEAFLVGFELLGKAVAGGVDVGELDRLFVVVEEGAVEDAGKAVVL